MRISNKILILIIAGILFPDNLGYSLVSSGFKKPIFITGHPIDSNELYVVEQRGTIWKISHGVKSSQPFLDIRKQVHNPIFPGDERGLLGFAISPQFNENELIYINYINNNNETVISRFNMSKNSEEILIKFEQPYSNHNGGMMSFGPDNYLYIAVGDGGSGGDPLNNAQNLNNLFGSILRIDVDLEGGYGIPETNPFIGIPDARPEIWAYGLRNPWRFSFDKKTGDLYIGDVGQNSWEEINFQSANSKGGENYGWNHFEGLDDFIDSPNIDNAIAPIHVYPNNANIYKVILGWDEDDAYYDYIEESYYKEFRKFSKYLDDGESFDGIEELMRINTDIKNKVNKVFLAGFESKFDSYELAVLFYQTLKKSITSKDINDVNLTKGLEEIDTLAFQLKNNPKN